MTDALTQIGKYVKNSRHKVDRAIKRFYPNYPTVDKVRDILDPTVPFEAVFKTVARNSSVVLTVAFSPPPPRESCADCYCNVCEFFVGESTPRTIYGYVPGSVTVFKNNSILTSSQVTETDPISGDVTINVSVAADDKIKVCYVYDTCTGGSGVASYPTEITIFIDDEDVTFWLFGTDTISPDDWDNTYRNIDISGFVRDAGIHTLRVEAGAGVGRVEARLEIN